MLRTDASGLGIMENAALGQVSTAAAEVYERFFVPALFAEFAGPVAEAAGIGPGQSVLDVACGTGVLAREAQRRGAGEVVGLDRNAGMLAVARRAAPEVDWREGRAEALPFPDARFDAVASQFGLMFFEDRTAALREMWRVLKPGGRLAVAVWDAPGRSPGYAAMIALIDRLFGKEAADALRAPFALGEPGALARAFEAADIPGRIHAHAGTARFPSLDDWIMTEIKGWTLADIIDDASHERLREAARDALRRFEAPDGSVSFPMQALIACAGKA